ncbi:hypothetical protein C0Q70_00765 [Pomacea canaliculata]|uniref:Uncharacterized protein n=1 Tax=Pomacea canaliculata TaxID=400727 RepID=A0A2T7PXK6_POMCA|nr:hypothetical protein C0Q70_00765 [Pomacea canaliculata]
MPADETQAIPLKLGSQRVFDISMDPTVHRYRAGSPSTSDLLHNASETCALRPTVEKDERNVFLCAETESENVASKWLSLVKPIIAGVEKGRVHKTDCVWVVVVVVVFMAVQRGRG